MRPILAADDNIPASEHGELLRQRALFHSETRAKVVHSGFSIAKFVQYGNAKRMRKRLEEFRLEPSQVRHEVII